MPSRSLIEWINSRGPRNLSGTAVEAIEKGLPLPKKYRVPYYPAWEQEARFDRYMGGSIAGRGVNRNLEGDQYMISALRAVASRVKEADLDEAVALLAFGKTVKATYQEHEMDTPDWLVESLDALEKEIKSRRRDYIEKEIKTSQARLEALKSADEKRADLRDKIDRLQKQLG
jgi:hypothetical protein